MLPGSAVPVTSTWVVCSALTVMGPPTEAMTGESGGKVSTVRSSASETGLTSPVCLVCVTVSLCGPSGSVLLVIL